MKGETTKGEHQVRKGAILRGAMPCLKETVVGQGGGGKNQGGGKSSPRLCHEPAAKMRLTCGWVGIGGGGGGKKKDYL